MLTEYLNNVLCNYSLHLIAQCRAACWDVNSGAGPGCWVTGWRVQVMVSVSQCSKLSPSVFLWATAEPYKHDSVFQCEDSGGHGIYQVFSCIVANNMISCY